MIEELPARETNDETRLHRCRDCMMSDCIARERERERALAWAFSIGDSMLRSIANCIALASSNNIGLEGRLPLGTRG